MDWEKATEIGKTIGKAVAYIAAGVAALWMAINACGCSTEHYLKSSIVTGRDTVGYMLIERGKIEKDR